MTIEQIEKFIQQGAPGNGPRQVAISFKTRHTVEGIFVKAPDYPELKGKRRLFLVFENCYSKNGRSHQNRKGSLTGFSDRLPLTAARGHVGRKSLQNGYRRTALANAQILT